MEAFLKLPIHENIHFNFAGMVGNGKFAESEYRIKNEYFNLIKDVHNDYEMLEAIVQIQKNSKSVDDFLAVYCVEV